MSPVGHSLAGAGIYLGFCVLTTHKFSKATLAACIILSSLPDLDLIPALWMGFPAAEAYHQGISHTFLFAFAVAFILGVGTWVAGAKWSWKIPLMGFIILSAHVIADALTVSDPRAGIMLFYPFSEELYLLPPIFLAITRDSWMDLFSQSNLRSTTHELFLFLPVISWLAFATLTICRRQPLEETSYE